MVKATKTPRPITITTTIITMMTTKYESDKVALTTEPCMSIGANWMIEP